MPLAFDVDGTLSLADTLAWLRARCADLGPSAEAERARRLEASKQSEKIYLWEHVGLDVTKIPYDDEVLAWAAARRAEGRTLVLVTGSAQGLASAVADHLGLFDDAWGSTDPVNLTGPRKAAALTDRYGAGGFDYVGDSPADLAVWEVARVGYLVRRPTTVDLVAPGVVEITSRRAMVDISGAAHTAPYLTH